MADKIVPLPLKIEKGKALERYRASSTRLATVALRRMGDMRQLRNAGADIYLRQAEVAAIVEFLQDKKLLTTDEFLMRVSDCMDKTSQRLEGQQSAIFLPGREPTN